MAVVNFASFASSLPLGTRILTGALLLFSLTLALLRLFLTETGLHVISFSRDDSAIAFPWLVIVPGSSFYYPWCVRVGLAPAQAQGQVRPVLSPGSRILALSTLFPLGRS